MSEETFVETYWRARADRNAKEAERYKAMADELAKAARLAMEWNWLDEDSGTIADAPFIDSILAKYDAMKGEE